MTAKKATIAKKAKRAKKAKASAVPVERTGRDVLANQADGPQTFNDLADSLEQLRKQVMCGLRADGHSFRVEARSAHKRSKPVLICRWCDLEVEPYDL